MTVIGIIDKANDLTINKFKIGMKIAYSFIVVDTLMLIVGYLGLHNDDIGMMEAKQAILLFLIFAVASSVLMCAGLTRSILKPLEEFDRAANMISDGDLTVDLSVSSKDELGVLADYFRKMTFNLKSVIYRVQNFAEKVTFKTQELSVSGMELKTTTNQMSNSIMEIAAGANKQASKMEEISRTMNEMSAVIQQVANGSQKTEEVAKTSSSRAQEVNKTSTVMVDKINDIQSTVEGSAGVITQLDEKSEKIGEIVGLITAIADQTSLLALNAAIEAARAGEHGRGFSVVADEVRKLAEEAGDAANQIAELIKEIQQGIKNSVKSMEQGKKTVEEGSSILKDTISNISSIAEASREAADMFHEIAAVAKTQSVSIEDVASSVENISEIATDSASAIQVAAASSEEESASMEGVMNTIQELETLSIELKDEMNRFKTSKKNQ